MFLEVQLPINYCFVDEFPDNKVHGTNMGPTWALSAPDGPHVGPMNLAIRVWFRIGDKPWTESILWSVHWRSHAKHAADRSKVTEDFL